MIPQNSKKKQMEQSFVALQYAIRQAIPNPKHQKDIIDAIEAFGVSAILVGTEEAKQQLSTQK